MQVGLGRGVLQQQLPAVLALEGQGPGQKLLVNNGQAVLVAEAAGPAQEDFRRGVERRDGPELHLGRVGRIPRQGLDQPEITHLDVVAHQEQVARLDVQVLQMVLLVHEVKHFSRLAQITEQLLARNAGLARLLVSGQQLVQVLVGQLHDDDQRAVEALDAIHRKQEGMANGLDPLHGAQLLLRAGAVAGQVVHVAEHELDGLEQPPRRLAFPHFAEPAAAQRLDQPITGDRLGLCFLRDNHFSRPVRASTKTCPLKPRSQMKKVQKRVGIRA